MTRPASTERTTPPEPAPERLSRPTEGEPGSSRVASAVVGLVLLSGGALALVTLILASGVATVFGLGWGVVVVGAGVLVAGGIWLRQSHPAWLLLPLLALVVPSVVITAAHIRVSGPLGDITVAPTRSQQLTGARYSIGVGTLLVDLRDTSWPSSGVVTVHVRDDLGRTVIALPTDRCIGVSVRYDVHSSLLHSLIDNFETPDASPLTAFGATPGGDAGTVTAYADARQHPVLVVDFSSQGGALYVRDYPASLDPRSYTGWPGIRSPLPARPHTEHLRQNMARADLADWRTDVSYQRRVNALVPGPCARSAR